MYMITVATELRVYPYRNIYWDYDIMSTIIVVKKWNWIHKTLK